MTSLTLTQALDRYAEAVQGCTACPARADALGDPVPCRTPMLPDLGAGVRALVVAPTPTTTKWGGVMFSGSAGRVLDEFLEHAGLTPEVDVAYSYAVRCLLRANVTPTPDVVSNCARFLRVELRLLRPQVVVALGAKAVHAMTGIPRLADAVDQNPHDYYGVPLVAVPSPALAATNAKARNELLSGAGVVSRHLTTEAPL